MMKGIVLRPPFLLAVALGKASSMAETSMLARSRRRERGYNTIYAQATRWGD
jgi:hypothetical protein